MPLWKREKHGVQEMPPLPHSKRGNRRRYVVLAAGVMVTVAIAMFVVLTLGPSWLYHRAISGGAPNRPPTDSGLDDGSGREDGPSSIEGPAGEFQAELYGIAESLVAKLPNSTRAHCMLASVHRRFAREADEARELQECLALDPACAEAHYSLGIIALGRGEYMEAEKHLRDAFDIDPRWADVPLQLAQAQISQSETRDAVSTLETYLKLEPTDADAWCLLGQAYQKLGDCINAKRCHLRAIEVNSNSIEAHYGVAKALRELGETEEARKYFEEFRQMRNSKTASVRSEKAEMTDKDFMRRAVVEMATRAGAVYAMHGCLAEAEECWTRASTLDPTRTECQEMLCHLRPNNPEYWLRLGHVYLQGGRSKEAKVPFQRVIDLAPKRADGYAGLAQTYVTLGENFQEAAELAQTAVQLESTAPNYFILAAACERVEDRSGAESALTHAIELDPGNRRYREARTKLQEGRSP